MQDVMQDVMQDYADLKDVEKTLRNMRANFKLRYESILYDLGVGDKNGGKTCNLSKFDGELGPLEVMTKQIYLEIEEAAEKKEPEDPKKNLNELEADTWKVTQSKPLRIKSIIGGIIDNSVAKKQSRQSNSLENVRIVNII